MSFETDGTRTLVANAKAGQLGQLANLFEGRTAKRIQRAISMYVIGTMAYTTGKGWYTSQRNRLTYMVSIPENDEIYPDLHQWLIDNVEPPKRKALVARTLRERPTFEDGIRAFSRARGRPGPGIQKRVPKLGLYYSGEEQAILIGSHRVKVRISKPEIGQKVTTGEPSEQSIMSMPREEMIFTANSVAGRDAVLRMLTDILNTKEEEGQQPQFYLARTWGDWAPKADVPARPLETVVLCEGKREQLIEDFQEFFGREKDYARLGIPWHRGYLFEGPPGSGKTSLAKALANYFDMDVYFLPLSDMENDAQLVNLVSAVNDRSMLIIEDIDIATAAKERTDMVRGVTMSGLLNTLDGLITPHGLITILTSNDSGKLDGALVRAGRVDKRVGLDYLDQEQFERLVRTFTELTDVPKLSGSVSPADVVEVIKSNLGDLEATASGLKELTA